MELNYDSFWSRVPMLLHFEGIDTSTVFYDDKGNSFVSNNGAALSSTKSKFGSTSGKFDSASSKYINLDKDFSTQSANFTLELWVNPQTIGTRQFLCGQADSGATQVSKLLEITAAGTLKAWFSVGGNITGTTTMSAGTWYHLAMCLAGGTGYAFVNGNLEGTVAMGAIVDIAGPFCIGRCGAFSGLYANAYIDELRYTTVARPGYQASFPAPITAFPGPFKAGERIALYAVSGASGDTFPAGYHYAQNIDTLLRM